MKKFFIFSALASLGVLAKAPPAQAQVRDYDACIQAKQSENDALNAEDWPSVIGLVKARVERCWWLRSPKEMASANLLTGLAFYFLGDVQKALGWFQACEKIHYSDMNCHFWLAVSYRKLGQESDAIRQKNIAISVARRVISDASDAARMRSLDEESRKDIEVQLLTARETIKKLAEF